MINTINEHILNNDVGLCYKLNNFIFFNKIKTEEELKKIEDSFFPTENIEERLNMCYYAFLTDPTHIEQCDGNTLSEVLKLKDRYESSTDEVDKLYCIMKIYDLINWTIKFPYTAYKLIIADKLK